MDDVARIRIIIRLVSDNYRIEINRLEPFQWHAASVENGDRVASEHRAHLFRISHGKSSGNPFYTAAFTVSPLRLCYDPFEHLIETISGNPQLGITVRKIVSQTMPGCTGMREGFVAASIRFSRSSFQDNTKF